MKYFCCDEGRREAVRQHGVINGIDYIEVVYDPAMDDEDRQRKLEVHFVNHLSDGSLTEQNVRIEGGERVRDIGVENCEIKPGTDKKVISVTVDKRGDFSTYTLRLIRGAGDDGDLPPEGFDQLLSEIDFSFKVNCASEFDCRPRTICPPTVGMKSDISYLARDYSSFKQLMLDRMAVLVPEWKERNAADLGITLVELLAYVGDHLSYAQDVVATEAYLGTARRRSSVRRHARLVDYYMHDGCNARVWVHIDVDAERIDLKRKTPEGTTKLSTAIADIPSRIGHDDFEKIVTSGNAPETFELVHDATLFKAHNEMAFYTWSSRRCCLPRGSTEATLRGHYPDLKAGDTLIFQEKFGPRTGEEADADPSHRHAVRLTTVKTTVQTKNGPEPLMDPVTRESITEVEWHRDDAMPFPLCISTRLDADHGGSLKKDVSVALGNIVLADHGRTIEAEDLGTVPEATITRAPDANGSPCEESLRSFIPARYRPELKFGPLTHSTAYDAKSQPASATEVMNRPICEILPAIYLTTRKGAEDPEWLPRWDLLNTAKDKQEFVVEIETSGAACLRFGDGRCGARPPSGTRFYGTYRVGNGARGNIGAETLIHIVTNETAIRRASNPMAACGGTEPESMEEVRQKAPSAFRVQERAVTAEDYARVAERHRDVQRAAATFRWTGSWHTVFLTVDRLGGDTLGGTLERSMRMHLERYRMAGHDVKVDRPRYVPVEIELSVCVEKDYFRSDVAAALLDVFSNRVLTDGRRGLFHPDNFTFGQPVYLSHLYSAAQAVAGVASVKVTIFRRQNAPASCALKTGKLNMGRLEIARLDNDRNFPHNGVLRVFAGGGK
jgi:hypothetical protein